MKRQVDYTWRVAERGCGACTTALTSPRACRAWYPAVAPAGYRVHQRPERVSLHMMAALCDIFGCGVEDLITVTASDVRRKRASSAAATSPARNVVEINKSVRPRRARVLRDDD